MLGEGLGTVLSPRNNSRVKRKIKQIQNWKKSTHVSWQQWKSWMYMQSKSLKTK